MTDHSKPLTVHVVSNNLGGINKNYSPYGTLLPMKDHYIKIKLWLSMLYQIILILVWPKLTGLTVLCILWKIITLILWFIHLWLSFLYQLIVISVLMILFKLWKIRTKSSLEFKGRKNEISQQLIANLNWLPKYSLPNVQLPKVQLPKVQLPKV